MNNRLIPQPERRLPSVGLEEVAEMSLRVVALLGEKHLSVTAPSFPAILTAEEVSEYLRVPLATLYKWRSQGVGPEGTRVGRRLTYRREAVDAWYDGRLS